MSNNTRAIELLRRIVQTAPVYWKDYMVNICTYCGSLTYFRPDEGIPLSKPHAEDCPWRLANEFINSLEDNNG